MPINNVGKFYFIIYGTRIMIKKYIKIFMNSFTWSLICFNTLRYYVKETYII